MNHLTRKDYAQALDLLAALEPASGDLDAFARAAVRLLGSFVAAELVTLSVCDLASGHRAVVGLPGIRLGAQDIAAFDRHFFEHPLVRHHGFDGGGKTHRISDSLSGRDFHATPLYVDYYQRIGLDQVVAVPLYVDAHTLVSIVLNRRDMDFSERDWERLELLRPHLAFFYRQACRAQAGLTVDGEGATPLLPFKALPVPPELTPREREVLRWLAAGKTDADIAWLLGISVRTVHKHLEHMYVKLGVETRTAAVMRALGMLGVRPHLHA
ncbi:helix-turn-helix transcriptional regulator [Variovorax sp. OV329]|uniref:helix-turn-helix transcriptional regulator n=1 Tax=Variovorax sp. OV329 TaxID=1882825 RepID=UPI0008EB354D|nr:helix-turn-helix transcriptional regulator [Variovorax sp. OV329]SFL87931.1 regulatory protein, luxR family [Variovorax sp. OV329]